MPRARSAGSVLQTTTTSPARKPFEIKVFRPVDPVLVAVPLGARTDGLEVGSGAGLGHRDRADQFALGEARQIAALLVLGAVVQQIVRGDRMHPDAHAGERAPGHFLMQHRLMPEIAAGAAPFLGDVDAEEAEFAGAPPQFVPDMAAPACFLVLRLHFRLDKAHPRIAEALDPLVVPRALEFDRHGRSDQRGAMRIAPSSRTLSPLK
jgi:hypothetical protein